MGYKNTLKSLIWVDEQSINPNCFLKGHLEIDPTSLIDNGTNPLIILSWICNKLAELVILGKFTKQIMINQQYSYCGAMNLDF